MWALAPEESFARTRCTFMKWLLVTSLISDIWLLIPDISLPMYTFSDASFFHREVILLPSGKFPRLILAAALLLALLLVLDLEFVRSPLSSLLISNSLDLAMVLLAATCSFYAARRSSGYARQLWYLLTIALALETAAQAVSTYYQTFVPGSAQIPWPSDILYFVWAAPVFMIFLPRSDEEPAGIDSLRLLDFLQVAILALTLYLYFFYSAARWQANQPSLLRQILTLYIARDLLLSVSFFFRSRRSPPSRLRSFSLVLALVFLAAVLSDADYLFNLGTSIGTATWGDLLWMVPYFIVILLAISWKQPEPVPVSSPSRVGNLVAAQVLPIAIPLLVIFMGRAIAREQLVLAWLAVTASVVCSSARLILTNRKQRRITENLLNTEKALHRSEQMLSTAFRSSPDGFGINVFPDGPFLEVNEGFTRLTGYTRQETVGKTPAELDLWVDSTERAKRLAPLAETGDVRDIEFRFRHKCGRILTGLMSASLLDIDGQRCSLVVVRDITLRKEAEDLLRSSEERFRSLVEHLHVGILTYDSQAHILFANTAALDLIGLSLNDIVGKTVAELGIVAIREDGTIIPDALQPVPAVITSHQPLRAQLIGWRFPNRTEPVWTLLDIVPEFTSAGELLRVVVSFTDVTQQRRATEALRESEERFRTLVRDLHVAVVLHQPDGSVEYVNPALLRMLGLPSKTFVRGRLPSELGVITVAEDGHELADEERPVSIVIRTRSAIRDALVGLRLAASGKITWVFGSSVPQLDANGNLLRVITSFTDMTEQRRAAEALRESEERFRTLVNDVHIGVILHRPDRSVEFANPAAYRILGIPQDTATGKFQEDFGITAVAEDGCHIPPEDQPVARVLRTRTPFENSVLGLRLPGAPDKTIWVFGNAVPQFDARGNLIRVITSFADITEMKNAERAIRQLSNQLLKLQDEERRRIGRELHDGLAQTVLAINLSLAQVRQSLSPKDTAAAHSLEKARELTQQMSREIRTLSYLLHPPLLDDLGLVSALREYANGFGERSGIETEFLRLTEFDRLPPTLEIALFRIVQESLANIQRHSGSPTARIRLSQQDSHITLEVIDFGRGIMGGRENAASAVRHDSNLRQEMALVHPEPRRAVPSSSASPGISTPEDALSQTPRLGVGIPGMRERMAQLGGHLEIISGPTGTTVRATIELTDPAPTEPLDASSSHPDRG